MKISKIIFQKQFIDKVKLHLVSGNGGNGNPKYGGKGGNGGSIFLMGDKKSKLENILKDYPGFSIKAPDGKESTKTHILGCNGENIYVKVPAGVDICHKSGELIGTVNNKETMIVCRGGEGGGPLNKYMAKPHESISVTIFLKLIADIGLVGFPNAGKSSFLNKISGISAKIANYPFTTIKPQVATIRYPDDRAITMADLPGIIEGAHVNVGLGHHFLKHVERTKLLLFVIDIYGFKLQSMRLNTSYRSALETILLLNQELEIFNPTLLNKPALCLLNKTDKPEGDEIAKFIMDSINDGKLADWANDEVCPKSLIKFDRIIPISAQTGSGIDEVRAAVRESLDKAALKELENEFDDLDKHFTETMFSYV